jgi:hypothetical protein
MKIPKSRGIAGILAAVIMFAMLFTAGMSLFLYTFTLNHQYDTAEQYSNTLLASKTGQLLSIQSSPVQGRASSGKNLSAIITNVGGNTSTIVQLYIRDQLGNIVCVSPKAAPLNSYASCSTHLVGSSTVVGVLPSTFSLTAGSSVNITTKYASNSASLTSCNVATTCSVNLVTAIGNVFTGSFPLPNPLGIIITTTLNATQISPGHHVMDTAILTGASNNAGGTVTYSWWTDGTCGQTGGAKTSLAPVTVTNGVVPNSPVVQFASQGIYSFQASYSGDSTHGDPSAVSACEPLNVAQAGVCIPSPSVFCFATVSQGVGSVAFDFNSFKWYLIHTTKGGSTACVPGSLIGSSPGTQCWLSDGTTTKYSVGNCNACGAGYAPAPLAYSIDETPFTSTTEIGFSMNVTNADPSQRTLVLNQYTQLWFSYFNPSVGCCSGNPHGQQVTYYFGLVNLVSANPLNANGGETATSAPSYTITYGQTVTLFFAIEESTSGAGGQVPLFGFNGYLPTTTGIVTPVFIFFTGTVGGASYGQDFPLASTLWLNIHS